MWGFRVQLLKCAGAAVGKVSQMWGFGWNIFKCGAWVSRLWGLGSSTYVIVDSFPKLPKCGAWKFARFKIFRCGALRIWANVGLWQFSIYECGAFHGSSTNIQMWGFCRSLIHSNVGLCEFTTYKCSFSFQLFHTSKCGAFSTVRYIHMWGLRSSLHIDVGPLNTYRCETS